jgi:hypothetical protein
VLSMPAIPTVVFIDDGVTITTETIATTPITEWPTLTLFNHTQVPNVTSGIPTWMEGLTPGGVATYLDDRWIDPPEPCFDGEWNGDPRACYDYWVREGSNPPKPDCPEDDPCRIFAQGAQLIHFPVTETASQDLCNSSQPEFACPGGVHLGGDGEAATCSYPPYTATAEENSGMSTSSTYCS